MPLTATTLPQPITLHKRAAPAATAGTERWSVEQIEALLNLPFTDLLWQAQKVHRAHHDANEVELATLLSVKTGGCPEDCGYCPQSVHYDTGVKAEKLMESGAVKQAAEAARAAGATRFCMGAAWRAPKDRDIDAVAELVRTVKDVGLEACVTLGMLADGQAEKLKAAGLDYYNHNLDCAPDFYGAIISTRDYQDRLDTLENVRNVGVSVCSGGIIGMGENRRQRAELIGGTIEIESAKGGGTAIYVRAPRRPTASRPHSNGNTSSPIGSRDRER